MSVYYIKCINQYQLKQQPMISDECEPTVRTNKVSLYSEVLVIKNGNIAV